MISPDHRSSDQLDLLIRQALAEGVANEEPPARVWDRIRAELTKPERQSKVQWSGALLQAALLLLIVLFSSTVMWQEQLVEQPAVLSSSVSSMESLRLPKTDGTSPPLRATRIWTLTVQGEIPPKVHSKITAGAMDPMEVALLQAHSSARPQASANEAQGLQAPDVTTRTIDISTETSSLQAKMLFLKSLQEVEPAEPEIEPAEQPTYTPGPMWQ